MMVGTLILAVGLSATAAADLPLLPEAAALAADATGWLLEGKSLPPDYRVRLMAMPPEARLQALIFLRRSGLLTSDAWALPDILDPAPAAAADPADAGAK
ncbi:hypothetical protein EYF88_12860 [Paracoccus sediminis]|uniref:Uncharacterized protein n=2 Tax=Paracoccus sediminis TaxID=1214787 RepID=A0ABY1YGN9_9RHOB|nr:hypothetical protein [Paracoccus sediminis]TBN48995.1 hypothetical protein EYF88_12860 [Paracoccus sediminis]